MFRDKKFGMTLPKSEQIRFKGIFHNEIMSSQQKLGLFLLNISFSYTGDFFEKYNILLLS